MWIEGARGVWVGGDTPHVSDDEAVANMGHPGFLTAQVGAGIISLLPGPLAIRPSSLPGSTQLKQRLLGLFRGCVCHSFSSRRPDDAVETRSAGKDVGSFP